MGLNTWIAATNGVEQRLRASATLTPRKSLPHIPSRARESNEKKKKAGQTSIDTHPARAPEGKTSKRRGTDHRHSLYSRSPRASDRRLCRQIESKKGSHCRVPRILFINPGGICGSFREHKRGRIL
ncbi:hypothetical protein F5144DRAFT_3053 [Chaetomium tenue]|uniref:Uncharacterized protein n=1 Tax=Chaetomium tenue TaxID=1854479 RepID=A0ACB7PJS5_9PEZI|nr:hypothetical protein F5144DRAFT_3053 [Chaetomium globosum]